MKSKFVMIIGSIVFFAGATVELFGLYLFGDSFYHWYNQETYHFILQNRDGISCMGIGLLIIVLGIAIMIWAIYMKLQEGMDLYERSR